VGSVSGRFAAEDLAYNTVGVTEVKNELTVKPIKHVADSTMRRAVQGALRWNPYTNAFDIEVEVKGGVVTLRGEVNTPFERATATNLAGDIAGVTDVDNVIKVTHADLAYVYVPYYYPYEPYWGVSYYGPTSTTRSDAQIAAGIRDELKWSPFIDAARVDVAVEHGKAVLTGQVSSPSERMVATRKAYAGGAVQVDNQLRLTRGE
jgi:osmotically-inducible protein OsmY